MDKLDGFQESQFCYIVLKLKMYIYILYIYNMQFPQLRLEKRLKKTVVQKIPHKKFIMKPKNIKMQPFFKFFFLEILNLVLNEITCLNYK